MTRNPIVIDCETIPCQLPGIREEFIAAVQAPGTFKRADSIAEWLRENREAEAEKAWLNTSFDGGLGQICVIGWAIGDEPPMSYQVSDLSPAAETKLLEDFFCVILDANPGHFIGHNIIGFDLKMLWKRAMVLGVKPPWIFPRNPKPWSEAVSDTMLMWDPDQRAGNSMDKICRLLGIPGKGAISGADVWPMVQAGRFDEVAAYCKGDVRRTRAMYRRMTFGHVLSEDITPGADIAPTAPQATTAAQALPINPIA